MKLSNKIKEEIRDLALIMALLILFCLCFSMVSGQNMLDYKAELPEVELNLPKPQNKFVARKQVNEKATVFIAGAALTGFGIYQLTARRSYNFDSKSVKGAVPLNPHNMLIGVGLFTMSISLVI